MPLSVPLGSMRRPTITDVLILTVALNHGARIEPARTTAATAMSLSFTGQR
jgi:hypothetical protein